MDLLLIYIIHMYIYKGILKSFKVKFSKFPFKAVFAEKKVWGMKSN